MAKDDLSENGVPKTGPRLSRAKLEALPPAWQRHSKGPNRALRRAVIEAVRTVYGPPPSLDQMRRDKLAQILRFLRHKEGRQEARDLLSLFEAHRGRPVADEGHYEIAQLVHQEWRANPGTPLKTIYGKVADRITKNGRKVSDRTVRKAYSRCKDALEWIDAAAEMANN
ncbi:hypothetical protein [Mesorhizobium sp.]|uniref:hypothetical protein n=1 Tax=Mesorhizobium sp. TaxID=1871066 RepID=UPI000FE5DCFE|nr:hypothetical protein [Mesorhizobium sp.]RWL98945.1 MAG: hypothetical protein EOR71_31290 [Mesorhizobium sp.]